MNCKICGSSSLSPIGFYADWQRCADCGSDSNPLRYADVAHHYDGTKMMDHLRASCADLKRDQSTNLDWFGQFDFPDQSFLDIGSCTGAGMEGMRDRGFKAWGFDVSAAAAGENVVIAPEFAASLFNRQFGCILLRETVEHVEPWRRLLQEAVAALLPGGLLQVQTPRPMTVFHDNPYQEYHLQLFSPFALQRALLESGVVILAQKIWHTGHAYVCRKGFA